MNRWQRWKAKHWDDIPANFDSGPGWVFIGSPRKRPLRRLANWCVHNGWKLTGTAIAAVAAAAALIQALR